MASSATDKLKIITFSLVILVLSQVFMTTLAADFLERMYLDALISEYAVVQKDLARRVEAALRFGKPLQKLVGMEKLLREAQDRAEGREIITVYGPDQALLYSADGEEGLTPAVPGAPGGKRIDVVDKDLTVLEMADSFHILLPLRGPDKSLAGTVVFTFGRGRIDESTGAFWARNLELGAITLGVGAVALVLLLGTLVRLRRDAMPPKARISLLVLVSLLAAQLLFVGLSARDFHTAYQEATRSKAEMQAGLLGAQIEELLAKGVPIGKLGHMEKYLLRVMRTQPYIGGIYMLDRGGVVLGSAVAEDMESGPGRRGGHDVFRPLYSGRPQDKGEVAGYLALDVSPHAVALAVRAMAMNSLTVTLIASLFTVEMLVFMMLYLGRRIRDAVGHVKEDPYYMVMVGRPAAFCLLFAFALPVSFIPLRMQEIYEPMLGLSRGMVLGLPLSVEMLCALVTALAAGSVVDKRGWHVPFLLGLVLVAGGMVWSGMARQALQYVLARGVCGLGYGLSWMAVQGYVVKQATSENRARGSANMVSGIISGHICGTAVGAMLADKLGHASVFLVAGCMAALPLAFSLLFMRSSMVRPEPVTGKQRLTMGSATRYLFNRNVLALLLCSIVPFSICQVGLLFYATPLYLAQQGVAQSDIGRVLMVYGLSVVYLAPYLGKLADRSALKGPFIVLGGLLGGAGLGLLYFFQGMLIVVAAVFLLGLSSSIMGGAQVAFALKLRATEELGSGLAMSIQRAADKMGQMIGPLLVGGTIATIGIEGGVALTGALYIGLSLLFLVLSVERKAETVG